MNMENKIANIKIVGTDNKVYASCVDVLILGSGNIARCSGCTVAGNNNTANHSNVTLIGNSLESTRDNQTIVSIEGAAIDHFVNLAIKEIEFCRKAFIHNG